jgi:cytoskeletal protein CcmA (bactofilin family)
MFTRKPTRDATAPPPLPNGGQAPTVAARAAPPRAASGTPSVIGSDLFIVGNLESSGEVQIEGEIHGDVHAGRIVIRGQANVTGELVANEVVIGGNVSGSIRGNSVTFQSAAHIEGDVFHKTLAVEQGAYFEGKSRRSDNPMAVPRPANGSQ